MVNVLRRYCILFAIAKHTSEYVAREHRRGAVCKENGRTSQRKYIERDEERRTELNAAKREERGETRRIERTGRSDEKQRNSET